MASSYTSNVQSDPCSELVTGSWSLLGKFYVLFGLFVQQNVHLWEVGALKHRSFDQ